MTEKLKYKFKKLFGLIKNVNQSYAITKHNFLSENITKKLEIFIYNEIENIENIKNIKNNTKNTSIIEERTYSIIFILILFIDLLYEFFRKIKIV
jgi:uncharacterized protein with ACT and thioredoxin-like domain